MDITAFCPTCDKVVRMKDKPAPHRTKLRNKNSRTGTVEAWEGTCEGCAKRVFRIIGR